MGIRFFHDVEKERIKKEKERREKETPTWELLETRSLVKALHFAKASGWKEKKVQVRYSDTEDGALYYVEPFEQDCGCRGILKYGDFFD